LCLAGLPAAAAAQAAEGSFERTLTVGGRPDVQVASGAGSIEVRSGSSGRIEVTGRVRANRWGRSRYSPEERVRRVQAQPPIVQTGDTVRIGDLPEDLRDGVSVSYTVALPAASNLRLRTGSGSQTVSGIEGTIDASTGSGSITVADARSSVQAKTGSGSIEVDRAGALSASTGSGSIRARGVQGAISAKSGSGSIEVEQTGAGNVEVSSSSGSTRIDGVRGALRASTSSGSLHVQGEPTAEWQLSSSSGHVSVELPVRQGFDLDANSNSGKIDLDFPVTVTGEVGKHAIRGPAQGGGPLLHIRTSSGGISIRKRS
jgi:DUF4097 and DUF4098 domain-containing protein YvlB